MLIIMDITMFFVCIDDLGDGVGVVGYLPDSHFHDQPVCGSQCRLSGEMRDR
jgi:hypothetical protein